MIDAGSEDCPGPEDCSWPSLKHTLEILFCAGMVNRVFGVYLV